ncbi:hypothetical protein Sgleb_14190 [Streptomyces glebosus]|uniref:Uncharacterized protein n=1 Tax=Streptomyces glebosus TaxID=249580 RepID=A0A640SRA6_9ACTN|nr:hypothetical protein Sgleb_14190 [Streptomyces glebosus]GHG66223.1 hypothetical protein GCM10010513_35130 [Streptomyces glebosus]
MAFDEAVQHVRDQCAENTGDTTDAQGSSDETVQVGKVSFGVRERGHHDVCRTGEDVAGAGQPDATAVPLNELALDLLLQFSHVLGHCGPCDVQSGGCFAHGAEACDGRENP